MNSLSVQNNTHYMTRLVDAVSRASCGMYPPSCRPAVKPSTVLFVDDKPEMLKVMELTAKQSPVLRENYRFEYVDNCNQAMALIATSKPFDVALVDYHLGYGAIDDGPVKELTAVDFVMFWRDHGYQMPFVVFSGDDSTDIRKEMARLGATAFMSKNDLLDPAFLDQSLQQAIGRYFSNQPSRFH